MTQWDVRITINGVTHDVFLDSDVQPVVFQPISTNPSSSTNYQPVVAAANNFLTARANYLAQLQTQLEANPPYEPAGPVPSGDIWWLRTGFIQNVPAPYSSTDMGIGVVLIWAPAGSAAPANDYS